MVASGSLRSEMRSNRSLGGIRMQDERKLYAHPDNEFEAEAEEYPDEVEDGFDDDEEEEEVSVIISSDDDIGYAKEAILRSQPVSVPAAPPAKKAPAKKAAVKKAVAPAAKAQPPVKEAPAPQVPAKKAAAKPIVAPAPAKK